MLKRTTGHDVKQASLSCVSRKLKVMKGQAHSFPTGWNVNNGEVGFNGGCGSIRHHRELALEPAKKILRHICAFAVADEKDHVREFWKLFDPGKELAKDSFSSIVVGGGQRR